MLAPGIFLRACQCIGRSAKRRALTPAHYEATFSAPWGERMVAKLDGVIWQDPEDSATGIACRL